MKGLSCSLSLPLSFTLFLSFSLCLVLLPFPFLSLSLCSSFLLPPSLDGLGIALGQVSLGLFQTVAGRFSLLCQLTGQHATSLTANLRRRRNLSSLLILVHTPFFLDSYMQSVHQTLTSCSVTATMNHISQSEGVFSSLSNCF